MNLPYLRQTPDGTELRLLVQPRASRSKLVGVQGDALKLALTAPPVDGAANKACGVFLAKLIGVPKGSVQLVAGARSRHKRFLLEGVRLDHVVRILTAEGLDFTAGSH